MNQEQVLKLKQTLLLPRHHELYIDCLKAIPRDYKDFEQVDDYIWKASVSYFPRDSVYYFYLTDIQEKFFRVEVYEEGL